MSSSPRNSRSVLVPGTHIAFAEPNQTLITAILPAYNEAGRILNVLRVLQKISRLNEIIVVDDGSSDFTSQQVEKWRREDQRVKVIRHACNQGKGKAIQTGWNASNADFYLLLDADLHGLTPQHVIDLISPVISGQADMTIGIFRRGSMATDFSHWVTPWLSGQRCLRAELLTTVNPEAAAGYGFETALTLAARRVNAACLRVYLRGVSHPPCEVHRGAIHGAQRRIKMYGDILRAWRITAHPGKISPPVLLRAFRLGILVFLVLAIFSFTFNRSRAASPLRLADIPPLSLENVKRVLIIAPHPDDETLAAGGLIQMARSKGIKVKVLFLTNGDGQFFAPVAVGKDIRPSSQSYIAFGKRRQREAISALGRLGVPSDHIYFLGYPDRGLASLWEKNWLADCPEKGLLTRATQSPYKLAYRRHASYCGNEVLADIYAILDDYRPNLILLPHPNDDHPDHQATANFSLLTARLLEESDPDYHPGIAAYLIHYGYFPRPRGLLPTSFLLPPLPLGTDASSWMRVDLPQDQVQNKLAAIRAYSSQVRLLGSLLLSFARQNEIFLLISSSEFSPIDYTELPLIEDGVSSEWLHSPTNESARRLLVAGIDLTGWEVTRLGDRLVLLR